MKNLCLLLAAVIITAQTSYAYGIYHLTYGTPPGDIVVYNGKWRVMQSIPLNTDEKPALLSLIESAVNKQNAKTKPLTMNKPLSGNFAGRDIYILDDSTVYFGKAHNIGVIYARDGLDIASGDITAESVRSASSIYIAPNVTLTVENRLYAGTALACHGGTVTAGGVKADTVWLDSRDAPLRFTVKGSVTAALYTQSGGYVSIGSVLLCMSADNNGYTPVIINGDYAVHNRSTLTVGGGIKSAAADISSDSVVSVRADLYDLVENRQRAGF